MYRWWSIRFERESTGRGWYRYWKLGPISLLRFRIDGRSGTTLVLMGRWPLLPRA